MNPKRSRELIPHDLILRQFENRLGFWLISKPVSMSLFPVIFYAAGSAGELWRHERVSAVRRDVLFSKYRITLYAIT